MPNRIYLPSIRVRELFVLGDLGQILKSVLWNMKALSVSQQGQRPVLSVIPCGFHLLPVDGLRMARHMCPCTAWPDGHGALEAEAFLGLFAGSVSLGQPRCQQ